jgi:hypothetical protein
MAALTPPVVRLTLAVPSAVVATLTIRDRIVTRIGERLRSIAPANGYLTSLGETVLRGYTLDAEPPVVPCINFWDGDETSESLYGMDRPTVLIQVETYDKITGDAAIAAAQAEELSRLSERHLADVKRAMMRDPLTGFPEPTFGGLADSLLYNGAQLAVGVRPVLWIGCASQWGVTYHHRKGNPYTQTEE